MSRPPTAHGHAAPSCNTPAPVRLLTAHKILISTALALALILSLRSMFLYEAHHAPTDAVLAAVALGVAFLLGWYLRRLFRR